MVRPSPPTHRARLLATTALAALIALVLGLAACIPATGTTDDNLRDYEKSIREEADWLWTNLYYAYTNYYPDPEMCADELYQHPTVDLTTVQRQDDPEAAYMEDLLDSALVLVDETHDQWRRFCAGEISATGTTSYMEPRLTAIYERLNMTRTVLYPRKATPAPGST
jgi:hypothetical protein